ncbi:adenosine kinase [Aureococcus anophagefferens]|nr:adenosine kinase [Aureococcus anophagefferens]
MRRSSSANGTNFEIVREIKWHQYIPIVNVIYDVFFDVPPTVDQLRELINMLLMFDTLLLSCVVGLPFNYGYADFAELIERFTPRDSYGEVGGVSEAGYAKLWDRASYRGQTSWHFVERFGQYYVLSLAALSSAGMIMVVQYLSISFTSFHDAEGKHSPRQLEAYWRWAVVPCFLATLLSILGAVFTQQTTYFLFVAVFPNRYVAAHGQWGDGRADHLGPWDSQRLSSAKPAVFAEGGDDDAALAAADLAVDDLAALDDALLANALLKDAGLDTAARLRVLLRVKGGSAVAEDQAVLALALLGAAAAFAPPSAARALAPLRAADSCGECDDWNPFGDGCKPCDDGKSVFVNEALVTSKVLRDVDVVGANGQRAEMSRLMGDSGAVPSYLGSLRAAKIAGPIFISVAPADSAVEKMEKFLDLNPLVPRKSLFVDDSPTLDAYASAGFKKIGDDTAGGMAAASKLQAPKLNAGAWWRYLTNVATLSPVPKDLKFGEIPEGVLRLGGTFVVDDDKVAFAHADKFPGDHPAIADVLRAARINILDATGEVQNA